MALLYEMQRHGGNRNHGWRRVSACPDLPVARGDFERARRELRQGAVALYATVECGPPQLLDFAYAFRNRTRW